VDIPCQGQAKQEGSYLGLQISFLDEVAVVIACEIV
jgi:hypothetical protein